MNACRLSFLTAPGSRAVPSAASATGWWIRAFWPGALAALFWFAVGSAGAAPRVAVVDCPAAGSWLKGVGIDFLALPAAELDSSGLPGIQVLVLPLDRVRSDDALRSLSAFSARGGKLLAVYWGTMARQDWQADYPLYRATNTLGFRVTGWTYSGPAQVKTEPPALPGPIAELRLDRLMLARVEPDPSAQVLARLAPADGSAPLVLALRNGNVYYVAANLFHRGSDVTGVRRFFFWMLEQAVPGIAFAQARERAGSALAAIVRARERLTGIGAPSAEAIRRLLDSAQQAANRARSLASSEQFAESAAASDQARDLTDQALRLLEKR
jgi:hypothetical protein